MRGWTRQTPTIKGYYYFENDNREWHEKHGIELVKVHSSGLGLIATSKTLTTPLVKSLSGRWKFHKPL